MSIIEDMDTLVPFSKRQNTSMATFNTIPYHRDLFGPSVTRTEGHEEITKVVDSSIRTHLREMTLVKVTAIFGKRNGRRRTDTYGFTWREHGCNQCNKIVTIKEAFYLSEVEYTVLKEKDKTLALKKGFVLGLKEELENLIPL